MHCVRNYTLTQAIKHWSSRSLMQNSSTWNKPLSNFEVTPKKKNSELGREVESSTLDVCCIHTDLHHKIQSVALSLTDLVCSFLTHFGNSTALSGFLFESWVILITKCLDSGFGQEWSWPQNSKWSFDWPGMFIFTHFGSSAALSGFLFESWVILITKCLDSGFGQEWSWPQNSKWSFDWPGMFIFTHFASSAALSGFLLGQCPSWMILRSHTHIYPHEYSVFHNTLHKLSTCNILAAGRAKVGWVVHTQSRM